MLPSSFMISHSTAAGWRPASCARSQQASVCPARTSTPPACAMSGNTWPGWTKSAAKMRSPSFSRSSSSTSTAMRPAFSSAMISWIELRLMVSSVRARILRLTAPRRSSRNALRERGIKFPSLDKEGWREAPGWFDRITRPPAAYGGTPPPRGGDGPCLLLAALLVAFDFLADARALARELAHVVELGAAHVAFPLQLDRIDHRGISLESALHALARGHLTHRERGIDAAVPLGDHYALVGLHALALALDDADVDDHRVARGELGELLPHALDFFLFELLNDVHRFAPWSNSCLNSSSSLRSPSLIPLRPCSSGLLSHERPSDCFSRQRSICAWCPESSTGGTASPAYVSGRVYCGQSRSPFTNESCAADSPSPSAPGNCRTTASISTIAASSPPERT